MFNFSKNHDCKEELKNFHLRATPARLSVMKFFETSEQPVDVNMILDYLRQKDVETNPATVFRMMNDFLQKGITKEVQFEKGKAMYELANKGDHHHLICERCGKIEAVSDTVIPEMEKNLQKTHGFLIKRHSLEFFGLCSNCQK